MRFRHPDGTLVHLAYCTNVHQAEDLDGVLGQLERYAGPVRDELGSDRLGLGLWLARDVASALVSDPAAVARLRRELAVRGLEVVTLNGFPYQGFHAPVVKQAVYHPDWCQPERLSYTLDLARVLAQLLPDDAARGSISTLPLGWREPWDAERQGTAEQVLAVLADGLSAIAADTGRPIRVGLEPEPGCVIETTEQAVERLAQVDTSVIGVCLDACHLAVGFENPDEAVARLTGAGLPVVKLQASAALHAQNPADDATRRALHSFVEQRFLHQARECVAGRVTACDDLDTALLGEAALPGEGPWRVHFHVPVHAAPADPLRSTQAELAATIDALVGGASALTDHIEAETYTWEVLPEGQRPHDDTGLVRGIAAELAWVRDRVVAAGLEESA